MSDYSDADLAAALDSLVFDLRLAHEALQQVETVLVNLSDTARDEITQILFDRQHYGGFGVLIDTVQFAALGLEKRLDND